MAYLAAYQITHKPFYASVVRDILNYVSIEMTDPQGGFYSAQDADSQKTWDSHEKGEGACYIWSDSEINSILKDETAIKIFKHYYGVEKEGNVSPGSDPHGEFTNQNILIQRHSISETATMFHISEDIVTQSLDESRAKLLTVRKTRPPPHLDNKIITAWNGLMISAYAKSAQVLEDSNYQERAVQAAKFFQQNMYNSETGILLRNYREGPSTIQGYADDYACLIMGLIDLYETTFDLRWLQWAQELQKHQDRFFNDEKNGGYYNSKEGDTSLLMRMKEDYDGAEPAASSITALNLLRLSDLTGHHQYRDKAYQTLLTFGERLTQAPIAVPQMVVAAQYYSAKSKSVAIAGKWQESQELLRAIRHEYMPFKVVLFKDEEKATNIPFEVFLDKNEFVQGISAIDGKSTVYVCEGETCRLPTSDISQALAIIKA